MKTALNAFVLAASLFTAMSAATLIGGCQTSHTETDKEGLLGGHKHTETTTTKNPITGDVSTSHTEQKTNP